MWNKYYFFYNFCFEYLFIKYILHNIFMYFILNFYEDQIINFS